MPKATPMLDQIAEAIAKADGARHGCVKQRFSRLFRLSTEHPCSSISWEQATVSTYSSQFRYILFEWGMVIHCARERMVR
jgi:hypothetical protein